MGRRGITLVELVVVVAIIGVLLTLLLPAVQWSRETSRRLGCASNLRQIGLALCQYESLHGMFPPGAAAGVGPLVALLPHMEQAVLYEMIDFSLPFSTWSPAIQCVSVSSYLCPSDGSSRLLSFSTGNVAGANYCGDAGTWHVSGGFDGLFRYWTPGFDGAGPPIRAADVSDGLSNTIAFSEFLRADLSFSRLRTVWNLPHSFDRASQLEDFAETCSALPSSPRQAGWGGHPMALGTPWVRGNVAYTLFNHVLPPNRPSCFNGSTVTSAAATVSSNHRGGVNSVFADGHVVFMSDLIGVREWRALGTISSND